MEEILKTLKEIRMLLSFNKKIFTIDELCEYANISKSYAYHLTSTGKIRCSKPFGKKIYFDKDDIDTLLRDNPSLTQKDIDQISSNQTIKNKAKKLQ